MSAPKEAGAPRRAARLAAVQALYQMELAGAGADEVIGEFVEHRLPEAGTDLGLFRAIAAGVPQHQIEIDRAIARCLSQNWTLTRMDSILRAILRAASYELIARHDVPAKVVIDEYVAVAHEFFGADEPGFVNAALDRMARRKRSAEFGAPVPDDEAGF